MVEWKGKAMTGKRREKSNKKKRRRKIILTCLKMRILSPGLRLMKVVFRFFRGLQRGSNFFMAFRTCQSCESNQKGRKGTKQKKKDEKKRSLR